jgi:hypothetical protein
MQSCADSFISGLAFPRSLVLLSAVLSRYRAVRNSVRRYGMQMSQAYYLPTGCPVTLRRLINGYLNLI